VPIYKFEKWVSQLKNGNLNTKISFRENEEEMNDLTVECNALAAHYRRLQGNTAALAQIEKEAAGNPAPWTASGR